MTLLGNTRERLRQLVARGEVLLMSLARGDGERDEATLLAWRMSAVTVVAHLVPEKHHYRRELRRLAQERTSTPVRAIELTLGVLYSLRDDLESGALGDVRGVLRREVMLDLLDRAEEHYERGYGDAAGILLVTILEDQLRGLCALNDLPATRSIDMMSAQLCKAGLLPRDTCARVQHWGEIGMRVVQHAGAAVARAEVAELLDGVARFLDEHAMVAKTLADGSELEERA
jgi:hypothetical protein